MSEFYQRRLFWLVCLAILAAGIVIAGVTLG